VTKAVGETISRRRSFLEAATASAAATLQSRFAIAQSGSQSGASEKSRVMFPATRNLPGRPGSGSPIASGSNGKSPAAAAALRKGEADRWQQVQRDMQPLAREDRNLTVTNVNAFGFCGMMRIGHSHARATTPRSTGHGGPIHIPRLVARQIIRQSGDQPDPARHG